MDVLQKLAATDPVKLSDCEVLELLLEVTSGGNAKQTAKTLIESFGSLSAVCNARFELLENYQGVSEKGALAIKACLGAVYCLENRSYPKVTAFTLEDAKVHFAPLFSDPKSEKMYVMFVSKSEKILAIEKLAEGNLGRLSVDPKSIIDLAVKYNASKAVLAHNHFSGTAPSLNDVLLTSKLVWILGHLGIELCEHFIFFEDKCHSMLKAGEIRPLSYNLMFSEDF